MTLNVDCLQLLIRHAHHCFAAHFRFDIIIINKIVLQSADIVVGNRHSNIMQVPPLLWVAVGFCLIPQASAHVRMVCPKPKSPASSLYRQVIIQSQIPFFLSSFFFFYYRSIHSAAVDAKKKKWMHVDCLLRVIFFFFSPFFFKTI